MRIVADELRISREMLGSLIKFASAYDPSISVFRVDARKISFVENLAFADAQIDFVAEQIDIAPSAVLSLVPSPTAQVSLTANRVHLAKSGLRHFDVRMRSPTDDLSDVATLLKIKATSIEAGDTQLDDAAATEFLSRKFTLAPFFDFRTKISVASGSPGQDAWHAAMKNADWPAYSIAVWRASMTVAPFDNCLHAYIKENLNRYQPLLEDVISAKYGMQMSSMLRAMDRDTDLQGNGAAWLSNRPLSMILQDLDEYLTDGPGIKTMDFYIQTLERAAQNTPPDQNAKNAQIAQQEQKLQTVTLEYQNTSQLLAEKSNSLTQTLGYLETLKNEYQSREQTLLAHAQELKEGAQNRAQIISAVATAASIAATAYTGNPATGAAVGGVITTVGGQVSNESLWTSLSNGYKFYQAIQGPLSTMSAAAKDLKSSRDTYELFIESFKLSNVTIKEYIEVPVENPKPNEPPTRRITRDQALKDLEAKGKGLYTGLAAAYKVYQDFVPPPSDTPPAIEEDESLKSIAESIAGQLELVKETTKEIEALSRSADERQLELTGITETLVAIRTMSIANEEERRELVKISFDGVREELARFTNRADLVRRSSIVEYRAPLPINPEHLQRAFLMQELGESFDPTKVLDSQAVANEYVALLKERRQYVGLLAGRIKRASQEQFQNFVDSRGRTSLVNLATEQYSDGLFAPAEKREFLRLINATIREQYEARNDTKRLAILYRRRIEIPFNLKKKLDARFPARLLKVGVLEASSSSKFADSDLIFTIDVERVGNLRQSNDISAPDIDPLPGEFNSLKRASVNIGDRAACIRPKQSTSCFSVDLRPKSTPAQNYFVPYEFTIGQIRKGTQFSETPQQSYWYLDRGDVAPTQGRSMMVTYPPGEARMHLRVRLNVESIQRWWNSAPKINKLVIATEVFQ
ncbi:MAG: hypothetical protein JNL93_15785 [Pelomonas sp.]|nr:hypothetical protein [Roseateles sp.]